MLTRSLILALSLTTATFAVPAFADDMPENQFFFQDEDYEAEEIPQFHVVNDGIMRGGRPQKGDLAELKKMGVKTIINIDDDTNQQASEKAEAQRLGLGYVGSPMSAFNTPKDKQVDQILAHLQDKSKMPIFIHCKHGEDRTGMIMGLYRYRVDKWTSRKAYDEMKEYGFHSILFKLDKYYKTKTNYSRLRNILERAL